MLLFARFKVVGTGNTDVVVLGLQREVELDLPLTYTQFLSRQPA